jgi:hypothetical protein
MTSARERKRTEEEKGETVCIRHIDKISLKI